MKLATRRIVWIAVTDHPDREWVTQQGRNLMWELEGTGKRVLVHDQDAKYAGSADRVVEAAGIRVIKTPIAAPKANAHMERQIGSSRRECFDWILIVGRRQLERVIVTGSFTTTRPDLIVAWIYGHRSRGRPGRRQRHGPLPHAAGRLAYATIRADQRSQQHDERADEFACPSGSGMIRDTDECVCPSSARKSSIPIRAV